MKPKGIGFFELHAEKIAFGLFLAALVVVLLFQFLAPPRVQIAGSQQPPAEAPELIEEQARRAVGAIQEAGNTPVPDVIDNDFSQQVAQQIEGEVADAPFYTAIAGRAPGEEIPVGAPDDGPDDTAVSIAYITPTIPATQRPAVSTYSGAVDPLAAEQIQGIKALLPDTQPYDKHFVSVEAVLDPTPLIEQINATPDNENLAPLTRAMRSALELVDIDLVRQRMGSNGAWEPAVTIASIPGRPAYEDIAPDDPSPADSEAILAFESDNRDAIRRPAPIPFLIGDQWIRPQLKLERAAAIDPETRAEADRLAGRIRSIDRRIRSLERQLDRDNDDPDSPGDRRAAIGFPEPNHTPGEWPDIPHTWHAQMGGGGGGGAGGGRGGGDDGDDEREQRRRERIQERIDELTEERQQLVQQLNDLGFDENAEPLEQTTTDDYTPTNAPLLATTEQPIRIWTHDLTAEPGETYRYAVRLSTLNPLFVFQENLSDSQRATVESFTLQSPLSEFSEPVTLPTPTKTFFVDATPAIVSPAGPQNASADLEIFHFFYGMWHRTTATLQPGDTLAASVTAPDGLETFTFNPDNPDNPQIDTRQPIENNTIDLATPLALLDVLRDFIGTENQDIAIVRDPFGRIAERTPIDPDDNPELARYRDLADNPDELETPTPAGDEQQERRGGRGGPGGGAGGPGGPGSPPGGGRGGRGGGGGAGGGMGGGGGGRR